MKIAFIVLLLVTSLDLNAQMLQGKVVRDSAATLSME